ncbi:MAG: cytochrome-c peroxidase [Gammaproteobacteria bacterium]|nr:cytochrome-c peroxidase [Gammaproteobacteria bacterium]MDH5729718.1 cytochrome-c peroxidase [Gammaproteobacteria bacterium]
MYRLNKIVKISLLCVIILSLIACAEKPSDNQQDNNLKVLLSKAGVSANQFQVSYSDAKVELGRLLFFDKILSGNRDIACATCHHPLLKTVDTLPLSMGTGHQGLGPTRAFNPSRTLIPRNSPELFNRGHPIWQTLFWDGRISGNVSMGFTTPAGNQTPVGLENILAAQALFPVTSQDEMRGRPGDLDVFAQLNEVANIPDENFIGIWESLYQRVWVIPAYQNLLRQAYPGTADQQFSFVHLANAIAEFEIASFTSLNSRFDRYLVGQSDALSNNEIAGAQLFYGKAKCADCHTGLLQTDQAFYNLGVPQLGPGKDIVQSLDFGRFIETAVAEDKYCFRTPSLRNVALTGPYMHNGAYSDLRMALLHHLNAISMLQNFNVNDLVEPFASSVKNNLATQQDILNSLDDYALNPPQLSDREIDLIVDFMHSLTDPAALDLQHTIPTSVPSGLAVFD